ncbi:hypothetical protein [Oribacterium sp. WCC10]|uniref:hypothetical protein n=1 Tax=Oribacterium sp. WCC10 TaxID=1855343 RepID=UPI0008E34FFF|nr:hypothetical protein [Oribacterium sp. WCC10]SFG08583.1 hypothetical protein SAMN05216356_101175 [Oribacterium sp. WCC10]
MIEKKKDTFGYDIMYHRFRMAPRDGETVDDLKHDIAELSDKLKACGIYVHFLESSVEKRTGRHKDGFINVEVGIHEHHRTRGAGWFKRKETRVTVAEVYEYSQSHNTKETAEFAAVSVRTLYNRKTALKNAGKWHENNSNMF